MIEHDPPFADDAVKAVFAGYPAESRDGLLRVRRLIFATAAATDGVGVLEESLKWGQPAYRPLKSRIGTTLRIDVVRDDPAGFALYVPCQTTLIDTYRAHYGDRLRFEGKRAIRFAAGADIPEDVLRHCIALALTYHRRKRSGLAGEPKAGDETAMVG